jgi:Protein of unknown function (DUF3102)
MTNDHAKSTDNSSRIVDAQRIELEEEFAATFKDDLPNIIRRGEILIEIKEGLGHGKWHAWLGGKFALSQSTAHNYMNAARFAEKYPTVRDLKISPRGLYRLAAKDRDLTSDQMTSILDVAKDRWTDHREIEKLLRDLQTEPGVTEMKDAPSLVPEQRTVPRVSALIDAFDQGLSKILAFAERPTSELVGPEYAPATSAQDLLRAADFLKKLAEVVESRTTVL